MIEPGKGATRFRAEYLNIQNALHAQWNSFRTLEKELSEFEPLPPELRLKELQPEMDRFASFFPEEPETVRAQFAIYADRASEAGQVRERFAPRLMQEHAVTVILTHALCEGQINAALAIGLARSDAFDLFPIIEKADFMRKWRDAPKSFYKPYTFPKGSALDETLIRLNTQRNNLVHYKINLEIDGRRFHSATRHTPSTFEDELRWLRRFYSLPYDLEEYVIERIDPPIMTALVRGPIDRVSSHEP